MALLLRSCFLALALAMYFNMVAADIDESIACLSDEAIKCFSDAGIDLKSPKYNVGRTNKNDIFQSISMRPKGFCEVKERVKHGMTCFMQKALNCFPESHRHWIYQNGEALGQALDIICQYKDEIDFDCAKSKTLAVDNCVARKANETFLERQEKEVGKVICMAYQLGPECFLEELPSCGCLTTKVYSDVFYNLYPGQCPSFRPRRAKCNGLTKELAFFEGAPVGSTGSGNLRFWLPGLFFTFSMAVIMSWSY